MAVFVASEPVNMNSQLQREFGAANQLHKFIDNSKEIFVGGQVQSLNAVLFIDFRSLPSHPFTYNHGHLTGGMISAITVDLNAQEQFKFTGLDTPIVLFEKDIAEHNLHAATELLLKGNDRIIGSPGDDVLLGGAGYNTLVFKGTFGHDTIADWSALDKIAFAFETNLDSYVEVLRDSHISHGEFVFVDPNNPNNTVTIPAIDEKTDLRPSELLFLHH